MKKKNTNHLLLNSLINTDFFFLKNNYFLKNLNLFNLLKLHKKTYLHILNPLDLIINLKQYTRILQFFNKQKNSMLKFFVQEIHQEAIINNFLLLNNLNINFKIFFKFLVLKNENKKTSQFLLFLKEYLSTEKCFSQKILNKNVYLVQEVNTTTIQNNLGTYKIFNKISDYKKLILLLVFIRQV